MAKKTAPSSRSRRTPGRGRIDAREWFSGIRLSGFAAIMLGLVVLAAFVLVPTIGTYVHQRQQLAAREQAVQVSKEELALLQQQRERWEDPAYITAQARERLYYVNPGDVVYIVDNDLDVVDTRLEQQPVSEEVEQADADWMAHLVRSITVAGTARTVVADDVPEPVPSPEPSTDLSDTEQ